VDTASKLSVGGKKCKLFYCVFVSADLYLHCTVGLQVFHEVRCHQELGVVITGGSVPVWLVGTYQLLRRRKLETVGGRSTEYAQLVVEVRERCVNSSSVDCL